MNVYKLAPHVKRIINYLRKSREEELQEERDASFNALERQKIQMERVLKTYNVPFDQEEEYGSGDKIEFRPVFQKILYDIRSGVYQAIAVREIARLGRGSYEDMGQIYTLLEEKRIYIITENRVWDLRNKDDSKFIRMQLFMSREEYFMINERLQGAREFFAGEGKFMSSRPPYGYTTNRKTKVLEINEEQSKYVQMIYDWYVNGDEKTPNGLGYTAISTRLSLMGVKTYMGHNRWSGKQISAILTNRVYLGEIIYKATERIGNKQVARPSNERIIVKDAHQAIISEDLFNKVSDKLKNKKDIVPCALEFDPCELAGIVYCKCDKKMVRQYSIGKFKKENGETSVYHKEFLYCRHDCNVSVKYRDVERDILEGIKEMSEMSDEKLAYYISNLFKSVEKPNMSESVIVQLEKQKKTIEDRLKFVFQQYEDQIYTKEEFTQRKETNNAELEKIIQEIKKESKRDELIEQSVNVDELRNNLKNAHIAYHKLNHKTHKNQLLKEIIDKVSVTVLEKGKGRKPSKLKVIIQLKYAFVVN